MVYCFCADDKCVQQTMISGSWLKSPSLMTTYIVSTNYETLHLAGTI